VSQTVEGRLKPIRQNSLKTAAAEAFRRSTMPEPLTCICFSRAYMSIKKPHWLETLLRRQDELARLWHIGRSALEILRLLFPDGR
jgi:hypothetical protein